MNNRLLGIVLVAASASFLAAGSAFARSSHPRTSQVQILYTSKIANGPELKPGMYKVEVATDSQQPEVQFYQNNHLIAEAQAKAVDEGKKSDATEIYYDRSGRQQVITELDLRGWNEHFMFRATPASPAKS